MNKLTTSLMCAGFLLVTGSAGAQDAMMKKDTMCANMMKKDG